MLSLGFAFLCFSAGLVVAAISPESVIRDATGEMYHALEEDCELIVERPEHLYNLVETILLPHVDFFRMSQWVLGKYWRNIDAKEREMFVEQFRELLIRTYATAILSSSLDEISYLPQRDRVKLDRATVRTEIRTPGEPVVTLTYSLYEHHGAWLVYDILVDGVSLVSSYRTTFADEINSRGFQDLLESIRKKNSEGMSAATADQLREQQRRRCGN